MESSNLILLYILSGATMGLTYALVALGFNVIYNSTDVINFAQGEFVMLGALISFSLSVTYKLPLIIAAVLAIIIVTFIAIMIESLFINPSKLAGIGLLSLILGGVVFWLCRYSVGFGALQAALWIAIGALALSAGLAQLGVTTATRAGMTMVFIVGGGLAVFGAATPLVNLIFERLLGLPAKLSLTLSQVAAAAIAVYLVSKPVAAGILPRGRGGKITVTALMAAGLVCFALIRLKAPFFGSSPRLVMSLYLASVAALGLAALLHYADVRPRIQKESHILLIIVTIGVSILIKGLASFIWGKDPIPVPAFSGTQSIGFFGAHVKPQDLWILGVAILTMTAFWVFYRYSLTGKAMRACSMDKTAAQLMGINVARIVRISFALAGATGAVAGIIIAPNMNSGYGMGLWVGLMGFVAAIVGGLGSPIGAMSGGLIVGLLESMGVWLLSRGGLDPGLKHVIVFLALLAVLYVKPSGIFGEKASDRF